MLLIRMRGERGSMTMSLLFTMIAAMIATTLTASVLMGFRTTRFDQTYETALQTAEVGVERLAHQVREGTITTSSTVTGIDGLTTQVQPIAHGWLLTGTAVEGTVTRQVQVKMTARSLFPYGVFADEEIKMVGSPPHVNSYDEDDWDTGNGILASNGPIDETHSDTWDAKYPDLEPPLDYRSDDAVQFIHDACEGNWYTPMTLSGVTEIPAGDYCVSTLTFDADAVVTVAGPVRLFVSETISYGPDVTLNCPIDPGPPETASCSSSADPRPRATDLQIYTTSENGIIFGKGLRMAGAVFAPRAECTSMPFVRIFGAMTCRTAQLQRAFFQLHYDDRLTDLKENWQTQWKEE